MTSLADTIEHRHRVLTKIEAAIEPIFSALTSTDLWVLARELDPDIEISDLLDDLKFAERAEAVKSTAARVELLRAKIRAIRDHLAPVARGLPGFVGDLNGKPLDPAILVEALYAYIEADDWRGSVELLDPVRAVAQGVSDALRHCGGSVDAARRIAAGAMQYLGDDDPRGAIETAAEAAILQFTIPPSPAAQPGTSGDVEPEA